MTQPQIPFIEPALVEWLAFHFPNKCPSETDSERTIWQAVGAQKVVAAIRAKSAEQQENVMAERLTERTY